MASSTAWEVFCHEPRQIVAAFDNLIRSIRATHGLGTKTKQLIYIPIKTAMDDDTAVRFHVAMVKQLGASRSEVRDAILPSLTTSGIRGVMECPPTAMQVFDGE